MEPALLQEAELRQKRILDADYSKTDLAQYTSEMKHLTLDEQQMLHNVLAQFPKLFGGGLGTLDIKPVHLEVDPDVKPFHTRAYPIPQAYTKPAKKELNRLCDIGVLKKSHDSEWAAPTFTQLKKTGELRVLTDFRRLNAALKRKPFPLPKISDLLLKLEGFQYATAIDLSMGYYHIPLDEESQKLCTTMLPWGKYQYQRLPMGIAMAPDIFQAIMDQILGDLDYCRFYLDDILIISNGTFEDHMFKLRTVLQRLEDAGFRANVRKCFFGEDKLEYLGYWLTRQGIQPQPKKVEAICRIKAPRTRRQLRHFLGMVNYYRDMWRRRSHLTAPLSRLVSKDVKWRWGEEEQEAFDAIKKVVSRETLLSFPQFDKPFHVYTDASNYQLGAVIVQEGKPLAFYSRKLNSAQRNYTTGEQELLSIVETLKEFRNILLGQKIIVHTDHKNILYGNLSNDRIVRWRLLLEEYGPEYQHIAGKDNVVADALSRLDQEDGSDAPEANGHVMAHLMSTMIRDESIFVPEADDFIGMAECFGKDPKDPFDETFPMKPAVIAKAQRRDKKLQNGVKERPKAYGTITLEDQELITYGDKVVIPKPLQGRIVAWYHLYLAHPGMTRLEASIRTLFTWKDMRQEIQAQVRQCPQCQLCKGKPKDYGHLPAKQAEKSEPWNRVDVDCVGPLPVKTRKGKTIYLRALTMIDPATGWFEVKSLDKEPDSDIVSAAMDDTWFCRYPRPQVIGYDNGSEFKSVFKTMIENYGLESKGSVPYNPQSHGVIERIHQVLEDALRTFELEEQDLKGKDPFGPYLAAAAFAIRSTYHTTLGATPAQLVFGRDMILPMRFKANWEIIQARRQKEINKNNARENSKRIDHTYRVGDKVCKRRPGKLPKLGRKRDGPYEVTAVYNNGNVEILRGAVSERINIRRLNPYHES
jgi:hypothetical protein